LRSFEILPYGALVIDLTELTVHFGTVQAVNGLSLHVPEGALYGLLGPNGAGKTTTIRCIAGLQKATSGTVRVDDLVVSESSLEAKSRLGVVPQQIALYEELSVLDNLRIFGGLQGLAGRRLVDRIEWGLTLSQLEKKVEARVSTLSGGMKRRLNLATSLLHDPKVVICDEPTAGVDPQSRNHLFDTIRALHDEGRTIVYTTHYMEEVEVLCDYVAIVDQGRVIANDTLENLVGKGETATNYRIRLGAPTNPETLQAALADFELTELQPERRSLEDVFLELTGRALRDGS
jgi:ABC-2 type transport system ATP-binding protein